MDGWLVWGGGGDGVRTTKMLILLSLKIHEFIFKFLPLDNCLPRCRIPSCHFRVVASTLSQERKNVAAMFTKLACLHALFLLCICPFVLCILPSIPDSIVTGTLNR